MPDRGVSTTLLLNRYNSITYYRKRKTKSPSTPFTSVLKRLENVLHKKMSRPYKKVYTHPWFIIIMCSRNIAEMVFMKKNEFIFVHLAMERADFSINEGENAMPIMSKTTI
jgi:hypothetical protein